MNYSTSFFIEMVKLNPM